MKTILVVDDESQVIELMKNRLEANHYNVISASDGAEGIKKAQQEKPDLILMDILMPNLSGGEAVKILQANPATKRIPVIFFTAAVGDMSQGTETGSINVSATSNGVSWPPSGTAPVTYSISGVTSVNSVPATYSNLSSGSYSLMYISGGPAGASLASISPCATGVNPCSQSIPAGGGSIIFVLNFAVPPPPPTIPAATPAPTNACKVINVSWGNALGATGYNVNRCPPSPGICSPVAAMWPSSPYQDTTASDGITYTYQIFSCNAFACSAPVVTSTVTNNAPEIDFTYTPSSNIATGQQVNFLYSLIGGNVPTSWSWTFAGGNPAASTSPNPYASFSPAGPHNVSLTVTNASGSCTVPHSVTISEGTYGDWCELPPDAPPGYACP